MFFLLSKVLAFLLSPINWIAFIMVYALLARNQKRKRKAWILSAIIFFVFTNSFITNTCMTQLEVDTLGRSNLEHPYEAGILLGGMIQYTSDTSQINFNANGDRLFQTIDLYQAGMIDKIMISSGSGLIQLPTLKEASLIKKYMVDIGIPADDILVETISRNTYENAVETRKVLEATYGSNLSEEFLLITSASHMRRSRACFRKQGIDVVPYSTTKRGVAGPFVFESEMILPNARSFEHWKTIFHESLGLIMYKLSGKI